MEPLVRKAGLLEDESGLHVLTLSVLLLDELGPEYLSWTSEALRQELERLHGAIGPLTWQRVQAGRTLQGREAYWNDWEVFEKTTAAISGEVPIFNLSQPPEAEEIVMSLETASRLHKAEFSKEVQHYIVAACLTDGLWYFEDPIAKVVGSSLSEHESYEGVAQISGAVAEALVGSDAFRVDPEDPVAVQVNRVLEVRLVLSRFRTVVDKQLQSLPELKRRAS